MSDFLKRLMGIAGDVSLPKAFMINIGHDSENQPGRHFFQIQCEREDVITGEWGTGYGGKAYLSEHMTDSELVQVIFGLYKAYWEHEDRETFHWKGRRIFGPHISSEALWDIAKRVDVRSARHLEDQR
jgi:hypothetical protein